MESTEKINEIATEIQKLSKEFSDKINLHGCENTPEVMALRKERDEYTRQSLICQSKIDKLIMESHKVPDLINKYVRINNPEHDDVADVYGRVATVERLNYGIRILFSFEIEIDYFKAGRMVHITYDQALLPTRTVCWNDLDKINIISKDDIVKLVMRKHNDLLECIEGIE